MISFKQYLTEARMGSLFHATSPFTGWRIIEEDTFRAGLSHPLPGNLRYKTPPKMASFFGGSVDVKGPNYNTKGVSFSRSKQAAINFGFHDKNLNTVVVFEIEQQKLTARNKIVPVSYIGSPHSGDRHLNVARTPRDSVYISGEGTVFANEYEEYALGDVKNVSKMIVKIHVMSALTEEEIQKNYPELWKHPKLYNSTNRFEKGYFYNN